MFYFVKPPSTSISWLAVLERQTTSRPTTASPTTATTPIEKAPKTSQDDIELTEPEDEEDYSKGTTVLLDRVEEK